jgi:8-oxo-dGTP diphosphatase
MDHKANLRNDQSVNTRIRSAALIVKGGRLLLINKSDHNEQTWIPPGGGLESQDADIFDCARREVLEETGIACDTNDLLYVREFLDASTDTLSLEFFITATYVSGEINYEAITTRDDVTITRGVRWFTPEEVGALEVSPGILATDFWTDIQTDRVRYLGRTRATNPEA